MECRQLVRRRAARMAAAESLICDDRTNNMYHDRDFGLYIGGQWSWGSGKQTKPILDPATEGVIGHIPDANAEDIDGALSAAAAGLQAWRKVQSLDSSAKLWEVSERLHPST